MPKDIENENDIRQMVDTFYERIRNDDILGPVFNSVIEDNWPKHLKKMVGFWQSILFNQPTYSGSAFEAHAQLSVGKEHFRRWLEIFNENIDMQFGGDIADEAKNRARKIGEIFYYKIEFNKGNTTPELL